MDMESKQCKRCGHKHQSGVWRVVGACTEFYCFDCYHLVVVDETMIEAFGEAGQAP
jgi:late competence protein required for DNA uptake (superfamily II DNA/RNA helicase)